MRGMQSGYTLIELLVALVVAMVIVLGVSALYLSIVISSTNVYESNRLTNELRALSGTMTRDIRRAGFWEATMGVDEIWNNPFTESGTDLVISEASGEATDTCILYSYDINKDGVVGDPVDPSDMSERFGLRLRDDAVEAYRSGNYDCDNGAWETVTTPEIAISTLDFSLDETCFDVTNETAEGCPCESGDACQHVRRVDINLTGTLVADSNVSETIVESVGVRNDKFVLNVP